MVFLVLSGCGTKNDKIDVGYIGSLTGRYSDLGQSALHGVMLAVENSSSKLKINIVVKDDMGEPSNAMNVMNSFEKENIKYIIGPSLSNVAAAIIPMIEMKDILLISPTVSTSALAGKKDGFFRTMPYNDYKQAETIAGFVYNKENIKSVVVLYDSRNASYSNDIVRKFTEAYLRTGGDVMDVRAFDPDSGESLANLVEQDVKNPPDMYYVIGSAIDTSLIIWQIRKSGYKSKVLIRKWAASEDFFRLGGEALEGVMLFDFYMDTYSPEYARFHDLYQKRFNKAPSWMSAYGYETARILIDALPDIIDGKDLNMSLNKACVNNILLKDFKFDEFGDALLPLHYFVIKNGGTVYQGKAE